MIATVFRRLHDPFSHASGMRLCATCDPFTGTSACLAVITFNHCLLRKLLPYQRRCYACFSSSLQSHSGQSAGPRNPLIVGQLTFKFHSRTSLRLVSGAKAFPLCLNSVNLCFRCSCRTRVMTAKQSTHATARCQDLSKTNGTSPIVWRSNNSLH